MNFSTPQHKHAYGIDRPARAMSGGILGQRGTIGVHTNLPTRPAAFLRISAPPRADGVVGGAGSFLWEGLADRWRKEGSAVVWGQAL